MAWITPRTWVASEVVTAAHFNAQLRDNMGILKTNLSDNGLLNALSAAELDNLSGTNLTGIVDPATDNDFTAGTHNFSGATFIVPVGVDQYIDDGGTKRAGCIWIEGDYLHYIDATNSEWRYLGTYVSTPGGAVVGSVWCDTAGTTTAIRYIDADGDERYLLSSSSPHSDSAAVPGSFWAETVDDFLHYITSAGTIEYTLHANTHTDGTAHNDTSHTNTYTDSHGNIAHVDWSTPYYNWYENYTDGFHDNEHTDIDATHGDTSHTNTYTDDHGNVAHSNHTDYSDVAHDDRPEEIGT